MLTGKILPPGEAIYPECGSERGIVRHRADGTTPCRGCRSVNAERSADYRKRRYLRGPLKVSSLGTQRRIRALMRIGWSMRGLEQRWGMGYKTLSQVMQRDTVTRAKAEQVRQGYGALAFEGPGPDLRARRWAERRGWPSPLDWDDIDNRDEVPACEVERAHAEALRIHREFKKMLAKREKRAALSAADRHLARQPHQQRRQTTAA